MIEEGEWGVVDLAVGATRTFRFGPVALHLRRTDQEVWIAHGPSDEVRPTLAESSSESDPEWTRWAPRSTEAVLELIPVLPDRLVVVAPEVPFRMVPGAHARIFVRIPLWIRVQFHGPTPAILLDIPTIVMSDTWWGDFASGELGYWLTTKARRRVSNDLFLPHLVLCPVDVRNASEEILEVEKLAVRAAHLSVYRDGDRLWADETAARYESDEEGSHIDVSGSPPAEAPDAQLVSDARERLPRGFRARTFHRLKSISGF